jgi:hydroxymethylpyrimidine pyrophosphatase-like HAD family hydrolase
LLPQTLPQQHVCSIRGFRFFNLHELSGLAQLRGLKPADILAIGDNWNDVAMLRLAGHAALMSNAPDDLKALAASSGWTLAPSNDEDGVAIAIEAALAEVPA